MRLDPEIKMPPDLLPLLRDITTIHPNPLNARTHNRKQCRKLAKIIRKVGFINPIVVDENGMILSSLEAIYLPSAGKPAVRGGVRR